MNKTEWNQFSSYGASSHSDCGWLPAPAAIVENVARDITSMKMKTILHLLLATILLLRAGAEPIDNFLFPPDLLVAAREEVQLTGDQKRELQKETDKMDVRFRELQERLKKENGALAAIVKPERVDEAAALAQLEKVVAVEREVKRAQLGFMLAIKRALTSEQQAKLAAFRKAHGPGRASGEEFQRRLVEKAERVRAGVEKLATGGGNTAPVAAIIENARKLMGEGKLKEGEAEIDRALKELGDGKK